MGTARGTSCSNNESKENQEFLIQIGGKTRKYLKRKRAVGGAKKRSKVLGISKVESISFPGGGDKKGKLERAAPVQGKNWGLKGGNFSR